jgi:acetyl esterase/lipase
MLMRIAVLTLLLAALCAAQPRTELLWPNGTPGAAGTEDQDKPTLTIYLPDAAKANGTAVIVCPGGGYRTLAMDHEGRQIAEWLNSNGVAAFVLKYRLGPRYRHPAPLQDALQAIRTVRTRASEFRLAPDRIGIWGFSAGGHIAASASTKFDSPGTRPDFSILAYPVISFTADYTHKGSRTNLLGETPDPQLAASLSLEKQVTAKTPPAFLFHTNADTGVPPENSVTYYLALRKAGVPAEMHIYLEGRHGVGLAPQDPVLSTWSARLLDWMKLRGYVK